MMGVILLKQTLNERIRARMEEAFRVREETN